MLGDDPRLLELYEAHTTSFWLVTLFPMKIIIRIIACYRDSNTSNTQPLLKWGGSSSSRL